MSHTHTSSPFTTFDTIVIGDTTGLGLTVDNVTVIPPSRPRPGSLSQPGSVYSRSAVAVKPCEPAVSFPITVFRSPFS